MFNRNSRYYNVNRSQNSRLSGGTRARDIKTLAGAIEHEVKRDDRLDRLAAHFYNDPHLWWLILDANPNLVFGGDLDMSRYTGKIIVIPANPGRGRRT